MEFPRLQLSVWAAAALALDLAAARGRDGSRARRSALLATLAYQSWWILPYTRLHRREVPSAEPDPRRSISILASNVLTPNRNVDALLDRIRTERPDVVVALETDKWWESRLDVLRADYPYVVSCPQDNFYGMHVYSRLRLENPAVQFLVEPDVPSVHAVAVLDDGRRVSLHCLHPRPPVPHETGDATPRDAELVVVGRAVRQVDLPVIVAGDMNDVGWSATTRLFRKVSGLLDPRVGRGMFNTFHASMPAIRWPLDHLFHSRHFTLVTMKRLESIGSDHFPIYVSLCLTDTASAGAEIATDAEAEAHADELEQKAGVRPEQVHTGE